MAAGPWIILPILQLLVGTFVNAWHSLRLLFCIADRYVVLGV